MRGDATLQARLLLRGTGLAGATAAVGGLGALVGAYRPWFSVTAELTMLGEDQVRSVADLAGWAAHPWGWLVPALGLSALVLGTAVAIDRPPARSRAVLGVVAVLLVLVTLAGALRRPEVARFDIAGSRLRELLELAERLPVGVELDFTVAVADGVGITVFAAVLILLGAAAARDSR